jgi:hypothetical protein
MGYIYKITNKENGMMYIGQTIDLKNRWKSHMKKNSNCLYLKRAIEKYGCDNFKFEIICICFDEALNQCEIEYIKRYNTLVPNGYNLKSGGNSGGKHHQETKDKISNTLKGKPQKHPPAQLGKPHTEEVKRKISEALKGRPKSVETALASAKSRSKPVVQLSMDDKFIQKYDNSVKAAYEINGYKSGVNKTCHGKLKQYLGFKWMFEKDYLELIKCPKTT